MYDEIIRVIENTCGRLSSREKLKMLLTLEKELYKLTSAAAVDYNHGIHPKHRLISYHDFFEDTLRAVNAKCVLDIGCGNGVVARSILMTTDARLTGIDICSDAVRSASAYNAEYVNGGRAEFVCADASTLEAKQLKFTDYDVAILSNVLEHVSKCSRKRLLSSVGRLGVKYFLVRVPAYDRDWRVPMMEELDIDYRLDNTHYVEYLRDELISELNNFGLHVRSLLPRWGEYWVVAEARRLSLEGHSYENT